MLKIKINYIFKLLYSMIYIVFFLYLQFYLINKNIKKLKII